MMGQPFLGWPIFFIYFNIKTWRKTRNFLTFAYLIVKAEQS